MNLNARTWIAPAIVLFALAADAEPGQGSRSGLIVWDTGTASDAPLSTEALGSTGSWKRISRGDALPAFKGDAVVSNGRILAVLRRRGTGAEIYSVTPRGALARAGLRLVSAKGERAARLQRVAIDQHTRSAVRLGAVFRTENGSTLEARFRLKRGDVSIETEPGKGAARLRVECPGRFALLPDFFADDILIDARKIPLETIDLPSENFVLHPTAGGNAIGMVVYENRDQDVRIHLSGEGDRKKITGSEIAFGKNRKVWLALLEGPHTWHARDVELAEKGKILPIGWRIPFPAQWRVDFTRTNELTDSWEMIVQQEKGGAFRRQEWFDDWQRKISSNRKRWTTVLGSFPYPCWVDHTGKAFLQPLKHRVMSFQGPALIYPINRVKKTPVDTYTVVDIVRNTLGLGPCEYILDVEGQQQKNAGINTCSVRDAFHDFYGKGIQKQKRKQMETLMKDTLLFVRHIRKRIHQYLDFAEAMKKYLTEQRKAKRESGKFLDDMESILREINTRAEARWEKCKTPEFVAKLNEDFRANVMDYQGDDLMQRVKKYTKALTEVGDNQDELVGECRWVVKTLRQRAGIAMATDPRVAPIAEEIRKRTHKIMRNPSALERARH